MTLVDDLPIASAEIPEPRTLRPAGETAAKERARQDRLRGRNGLLAFVAELGPKLRRLGGADAAREGLRYRPVIWTVIVVVAVAFFFPGRDGGNGADVAVASSPTTVPFVPTSSPDAADATAPTTIPITSPPTTRFVVPAPAAPAPRVSATPTTAVAHTTTTTTTAPPPPVPLSVSGWGWAGSTGAVDVSVSPVPEGTLPVANRLGGVDKVSFVRLTGTATTLRLEEDVEGAREALGAAAIQLCPIEDAGWAEEPGQSMDAAPTWADSCVAGVEADDAWTFDLSGLGDPASPNGFALVPGADAPADFQVTLQP